MKFYASLQRSTKKSLKLILCLCVFLVLILGYLQFRINEHFVKAPKKIYPENFPPIKLEDRRCDNLLFNLVEGRWVHWTELEKDITSEEYRRKIEEEKRFDDHMNEFRIKRGIHTKLWRDDLKCGLKNLQTKSKGNEWGEPVSSWCDAKSEKPCCNDEHDGTCTIECECPKCIDMRNILHAEFARWTPFDQTCKWKNYTADEACEVIERFTQIHIVGDSMVRKMGRVLISLLRSDPTQAIIAERYDEKLKALCKGPDQLYWSECELKSGSYKEQILDKRPVCNRDLSAFALHDLLGPDSRQAFFDIVKNLAGKRGSIIVIGLSELTNYQSKIVINEFMEPALQYIDAFYKKVKYKHFVNWPIIIYMLPDTPGLLKSPFYHPDIGKLPPYNFTDELKSYFSRAGVPYFDFGRLTTGVHSYDGIHYGIGINTQKVQIMLNYLDVLE